MLVKVAEAENPVLNWMVAKAQGYRLDLVPEGTYTPSTDPAQAYPIIFGEQINTNIHVDWVATIIRPGTCFKQFGPTPLIAAMRCYVVSELGEEVEVPDDLT